MTEHTNLPDTFAVIAEQVRLHVTEEYPAVKVTNVDFNAGVFYPITYGDIADRSLPVPVPGTIRFRVEAFTILPDKPYQHKHTVEVAAMSGGLQIVRIDTRRSRV